VVIPFAAEQVAPDYWQTVIAGMAQAGQPIALIPIMSTSATPPHWRG
jgi:hypothetical protein